MWCRVRTGSRLVEIRNSLELSSRDQSRQAARGPLVNRLHRELHSEGPVLSLWGVLLYDLYYYLSRREHDLSIKLYITEIIHTQTHVGPILCFIKEWHDSLNTSVYTEFHHVSVSVKCACKLHNTWVQAKENPQCGTVEVTMSHSCCCKTNEGQEHFFSWAELSCIVFGQFVGSEAPNIQTSQLSVRTPPLKFLLSLFMHTLHTSSRKVIPRNRYACRLWERSVWILHLSSV